MTNSLIPYSFTPGTKAKAQEVNANFTSIATQIEENKEYSTNKIQETFDDLDAKKADKKLSNTDLITNCILEAPEGVLTYSGNSIVIKKGLKVLIPDGRKLDGTLKTTEYTVPEDFTITTQSNETENCVYVSPSTNGTAVMLQYCHKTPPSSKGLLYNYAENQYYLYNTSTTAWEKIQATAIATYQNLSGTIKNVKIFKPLELLKENDISRINIMGTPDYPARIYKMSGVAQTNGFITVYAVTQGGCNIGFTIDGVSFQAGYHPNGQMGGDTVFLPVTRGAVWTLISPGGIDYCYFIPAKGEV